MEKLPSYVGDYAINVISMSQSHEIKIPEPEPIMMVHVMPQGLFHVDGPVFWRFS